MMTEAERFNDLMKQGFMQMAHKPTAEERKAAAKRKKESEAAKLKLLNDAFGW